MSASAFEIEPSAEFPAIQPSAGIVAEGGRSGITHPGSSGVAGGFRAFSISAYYVVSGFSRLDEVADLRRHELTRLESLRMTCSRHTAQEASHGPSCDRFRRKGIADLCTEGGR